MSIFGTIMSKIFGKKAEEGAAADISSTTPTTSSPNATALPDRSEPSSSRSGPAAVDVAAVLDEMTKSAGQKLNWRVSIVDLMKLIGLDSSLAARKQLAKELSYAGDGKDSAAMNIWLHKQVMTKLAENGGMVPDELRH